MFILQSQKELSSTKIQNLYIINHYIKKILFKKGYPFNSERKYQNLNQNYNLKCNNAERLHNSILINEHVRHPHLQLYYMSDIINFFKNIINKMKIKKPIKNGEVLFKMLFS